MMEKTDRIYIAGHTGMVGTTLQEKLKENGFHQLITRKSSVLDLKDQSQVNRFFAEEQPDIVFLLAARVGGILDNATFPAEYLYDNLMIQSNVIHASFVNSVKKLLFLGSSCIYPRLAPQPIKETSLLSGPLEPTNAAYSIAKIAGIKMCESYSQQYSCNFISGLPCNIYGVNDNFDLASSHVLPALLRKFHEAKVSNNPTVEIWGTGTPKREFIHVDDLTDACIHLMKYYNSTLPINIGTGEEISILDLAIIIKDIVGFNGTIIHDLEKPDGMPAKVMDISKINALGWKAKITLKKGIEKVYNELKDKSLIR